MTRGVFKIVYQKGGGWDKGLICKICCCLGCCFLRKHKKSLLFSGDGNVRLLHDDGGPERPVVLEVLEKAALEPVPGLFFVNSRERREKNVSFFPAFFLLIFKQKTFSKTKKHFLSPRDHRVVRVVPRQPRLGTLLGVLCGDERGAHRRRRSSPASQREDRGNRERRGSNRR